MRTLLALLVLGSIATAASAAGTDIHELAQPVSQQQSNTIPQPGSYGDAFRRVGTYFGRGAGGVGHW